MGLIYIFIRIYPFFAFGMVIALIDASIALRRKGMKKEMFGVILVGILFFASGVWWILMRGDKNADLWFKQVSDLLFPR